jgi:hypothetical protein
MLWFFERADEVLELETRYDNETHEYVLERRSPGMSVQIERFSSAAEFRQRLEAIEAGLSHQQWQSKGQPVILADGWPDKMPSQ